MPLTRLLLAVLLLWPGITFSFNDPPIIAVASNFYPALKAVSHRYSLDTGNTVLLSAGASGTLTRQIIQGAPYQLFLSADESYINELYRRELVNNPGTIYALGQLVLFIHQSADIDSANQACKILDGIRLRDKNNIRIAIANPELAPYGRAAREVLKHSGLWQNRQIKVIQGENSGQAAQFIMTDAVDLALLPLSLAMNQAMAKKGSYQPVDPSCYTPVRQRMVLLPSANEAAQGLYRGLASVSRRRVNNGLAGAFFVFQTRSFYSSDTVACWYYLQSSYCLQSIPGTSIDIKPHSPPTGSTSDGIRFLFIRGLQRTGPDW